MAFDLNLVADRFGRCAVCGRREKCCDLCHRGHTPTGHRDDWHCRPHGTERCDLFGDECPLLNRAPVGLARTDEFAIEEARRG